MCKTQIIKIYGGGWQTTVFIRVCACTHTYELLILSYCAFVVVLSYLVLWSTHLGDEEAGRCAGCLLVCPLSFVVSSFTILPFGASGVL